MNEATFEFKGKEFHLSAPDTQMLHAGLARFATGTLVGTLEAVVPGPVRRVVDVGACIGYYTMIFHETWPDADILAIEPSSLNFRHLMLNTWYIPGVRHMQLAIGEGIYTHSIAMPTLDQKKMMNFSEGNSGIMSLWGESDIYREDVQVVKLDGLIDWCDFIKIDTEGYEDRVIQGADRLLREARPALHVEFVHANRELSGVTAKQLLEQILSYDYVMVHAIGFDGVFVPRERVCK